MAHVVQKPTAPFPVADGRLVVHQIPAWTDNLIWLLEDQDSREAAVVDGPEAGGVLDYCNAQGLRLTTIVNTHTHPDHVGINRDLEGRGLLSDLRVYGPKGAAAGVPGLTDPVDEGDTVIFGGCNGAVLRTEGHIDGHVSFVFEDVLFCGDTLFGAGCGYLFDGPPSKMHTSLRRLAQLPPGTLVCCAHEYTEDNLRFAWSVEPDNARLEERIRTVRALRTRGECSVPSTIAEELATNPFLRTDSPTLRAAVAAAMPEHPLDDAVDVFAATRALKDRKDYKRAPADDFPG